MGKFKGLLFVTDLDGTLLRKDKSVSEEDLNAIEYFKSEGGIFTFITGRLPAGSRSVFEMVKPNAPCGCINGGGIYDYEKGEFLWSMELSKDVFELVEYVDKNIPEMGIEVNLHEKIYFCKKSTSTEEHRIHEHFPDLTCHYRDVKEPIAKILFADKNIENIEKLIDMLVKHPSSSRYDFIRSYDEYYEILPKGASKGNLLKQLSQMLGIDEKKTIAVGDNDNDVSMIKRAHLGIAVSNATESVKSVADYITVSHEENAIAKIIDDIDSAKIHI